MSVHVRRGSKRSEMVRRSAAIMGRRCMQVWRGAMWRAVAFLAGRLQGWGARGMSRHGEMVNAADLKSAGPRGSCGFESRCRYSVGEAWAVFGRGGGPAEWMFDKLLSGSELHAEGGGLFQDVGGSGWRLWQWGHRQDARATLQMETLALGSQARCLCHFACRGQTAAETRPGRPCCGGLVSWGVGAGGGGGTRGRG